MKKFITIICLMICCNFVIAQDNQQTIKEEKVKIQQTLGNYIVANETQNIKLMEEIGPRMKIFKHLGQQRANVCMVGMPFARFLFTSSTPLLTPISQPGIRL